MTAESLDDFLARHYAERTPGRVRCAECAGLVPFHVVMAERQADDHLGVLARRCAGSGRAPMRDRTRAAYEKRHELSAEEERGITFSILRGSPRGDLYQRVVARFRTPRTTPRPGGIWEDPAPDWLWKLAQDILEHTGAEPDAGAAILERTILWCRMGGNPEVKASRIVGPRTIASRGPDSDGRYLHDLRAILDQP